MVKEDFIWIGGAPWLDFINTEVITGAGRVDLLANGDDLVTWLTASQTVPASMAAATLDRDDLLKKAKELRLILRGLCEGFGESGGRDRGLIEKLNIYLASPAPGSQLQWSAEELKLKTDWSQTGPRQLLYPIAQAAAETLSSGDLSRLRKCGSDQCILWFLDTSKNGQRRWCSMEICGNRHKVSQHNLRKKG